MDIKPVQAVKILYQMKAASVVSSKYSENNGIILLVWGLTFLLDMVGFDISHALNSIVSGIVFICVLNLIVLVWRFRYVRHLPVRPLRSTTNKVIFWWSLYYVALGVSGIGAWAIFVGTYPPYWFSLLGVLGSFPLILGGLKQWSHTHQ